MKNFSFGVLMAFSVASCSQSNSDAPKTAQPTIENQIVGKWTNQTIEVRFKSDGGYMEQEGKGREVTVGNFEFNPDTGVLVLAPKGEEKWPPSKVSFPSQNELLVEFITGKGTTNHGTENVLLKRVQE